MILMHWNGSCYQRRKCKVLTGSFTVYHDSFMVASDFFGEQKGMSLILRKGVEMKKIAIRDEKTQEVIWSFSFDDQDKTVLPRFRQGLKQLLRLGRAEKQELRRALSGRVRTDQLTERSREQVDRRNQAVEIFEGVLGIGAVRKIYVAAYDADPYFIPSAKMLADILMKITGEVKKLTEGRHV